MTGSSSTEEKVFNWLALHQQISGQQLAQRFSVSRAAIWKAVSRLRAAGVPIASSRGHGYVLTQPVQPLSADALQTACPVPCHVFFHTGSTNDDARALKQDGFVVAELQSRGRGRMGRQWLSVPGCSITLSGRFSIAQGIADLAGLNLAVAAAVWRCANNQGLSGLKLKWPNDLVLESASGDLFKVGGVLIEVGGEMEGPCQVVAGLGLNWHLPRDAIKTIEQPTANLVDLAQRTGQTQSPHPDRLKFLSALLPLICEHVRNWCHPVESRRQAFRQAVLDLWRQADALLNRDVWLFKPGDRRHPCLGGRYRGVLPDGAMQLETRSGLLPFHSGEVSLRPAANYAKNTRTGKIRP